MGPAVIRLLVSGSRSLTDREYLFRSLDTVVRERIPANEPVVLVHGGAQGADRLAAQWARERGHETEPHPADWRRHRKRAGGLRNQEMVDAGADRAVFFPLPGSTGTYDCLDRCLSAHIPVEVFHCHRNRPTPRQEGLWS